MNYESKQTRLLLYTASTTAGAVLGLLMLGYRMNAIGCIIFAAIPNAFLTGYIANKGAKR